MIAKLWLSEIGHIHTKKWFELGLTLMQRRSNIQDIFDCKQQHGNESAKQIGSLIYLAILNLHAIIMAGIAQTCNKLPLFKETKSFGAFWVL